MHRAKGQIEIVAVVAFVIIGVVAALIVLSPGNPDNTSGPGQGTSDQSSLIRDSVMNLIRKAALDNVNTIYDNGGYLDAKRATNVEYGGLKIPVWQACSNSMAPDVERELSSGIRTYISDNLQSSDFFGLDAEFDLRRLKVDANIIDGRVDVKVELPTKVDGVDVPADYNVFIPSDIYNIISFSNGFVTDANENNFFETATISSMVKSNPDSDSWMPIAGMVSECGKRIIKTRTELLPAMKQMIRYAISHVVWNADPIEVDNNLFFPINSAGGETFDLDVEFAYPPSWDSELDRRFSSTPETLNVVGRPIIPIVPVCMTPYSMLYSFQYPVVISVKDKISDKYFRFAILVSVKNNAPDETCQADIFSGSTEYTRECVDRGECDYNITVKDSSGNPINDARVSFYMCDLGVTDENGQLISDENRKAPCLISSLEVYKDGYRTYTELASGQSLDGIEISLIKRQSGYKVHFFGVPVKAKGSLGNGEYSSYEVIGEVEPITDSGSQVMAEFHPIDPNYYTGEDFQVMISNNDDNGDVVSEVTTSGFYPGEFYAVAATLDNETQNMTGIMNISYTVLEGDNSVYIYLPFVKETDSGIRESINGTQASKMAGLSGCFSGGAVIASTEQSDVMMGCEF